MTVATAARRDLEIIPSIDILGGRVVRLTHGKFDTAVDYGDPLDVARRLELRPGMRLHVVDLEASRSGESRETGVIAALASSGLDLQVGGGVRSLADARRLRTAGARRVVLGTVAAKSPDVLRAIVDDLGADAVVVAIDVRDGQVRTDGWERSSGLSLHEVVASVAAAGAEEILVTDISHDGTLRGPSFALYRELVSRTSMRVIASGGVGQASDVAGLSRIDGLAGVILGKALHAGRITIADAIAHARSARSIAARVIPCLDMRGGRVVKGVRFTALRDAGDPVEAVQRYQDEGADEITVLDISATDEERNTSLDTVEEIASSLFIPLTVGGGVRTPEDFRRLLGAGADRVAMNTAAVMNPALIDACAAEFGVQAVVLACDALRSGDGFNVVTHAGKRNTGRTAADWLIEAEKRGAGEILLTSIDRDGTGSGYDIELLRSVTAAVRIGVIASGGAGALDHFCEAIEQGGAGAVLAASLFHDGVLRISDVKARLRAAGIPVR